MASSRFSVGGVPCFRPLACRAVVVGYPANHHHPVVVCGAALRSPPACLAVLELRSVAIPPVPLLELHTSA